MRSRYGWGIVLASAVLLGGCTRPAPDTRAEQQSQGGRGVTDFLRFYNETYQRLSAVANEADWRASTNVNEQNIGARIGANEAQAAFQGSRYIIETSRSYLANRTNATDLEFRQLDKILLNAGESPGTVPDIVSRRVAAEARLSALLDSFEFCLEKRGGACVKPVTPNQIDEVLRSSADVEERRRYWEASKQSGFALKEGLRELRTLRNRVAQALGYSSYFHLQVADYGMSVADLMDLMKRTVEQVRPLYSELHLWARRRMAEKFRQPLPETMPAHWSGNRWAQDWPGLLEAVPMDEAIARKSPEWIVQQAERFYVSMGFPALPKSFWERSDLYELPANSTRKKNTHASAWHIDLESDVRSLMSVTPNMYWFNTAHHELGHVYYYIAYTNPRVPVVLREGANRAFHEAVGDLISIAANQEQYLKQAGLLPGGRTLDKNQRLLSEALENFVFLPFAAGVMTSFEHDLYEKNLPAAEWNQRWWQYVNVYQGVTAPAPRPNDACDACTKTHIIDDPAQYYDYAVASLIKYQLHDFIARRILNQDPRDCNYYGNKEVGRWLQDLLAAGATRDWRTLLREKTGEDLSSRAMLEYFAPLAEWLKQENQKPVPATPVARRRGN